uniref:Uncharacterized protein n=1 Tax=Anguilla anguilla TaxID=7936 RepID=A0A0E9RD04_ANGAN
MPRATERGEERKEGWRDVQRRAEENRDERAERQEEKNNRERSPEFLISVLSTEELMGQYKELDF